MKTYTIEINPFETIEIEADNATQALIRALRIIEEEEDDKTIDNYYGCSVREYDRIRKNN